MKLATDDRGEIIHFAGFHALSPALADGRPALTSGGDPAATRCGWEPFFRAMGEQQLALVLDDADPAASSFQPAAQVLWARPEAAPGHSALEHALRFLEALRPPGKREH
ncbi:hypothetical protein [Anaeromyxobacter paludicola]|uniref:Uncharacterized protein n=1 Tax=Anaeromyxobacter paludicola TaxID=2918171 RepID=A0ABN6N209_9BACT|nr:hypothetical protein [Anaeromyxobacter paludicola]BDG07208.1 hypothetical protein AMPC_03210 [Anaeromyxobacter paludicola]